MEKKRKEDVLYHQKHFMEQDKTFIAQITNISPSDTFLICPQTKHLNRFCTKIITKYNRVNLSYLLQILYSGI